MLARGSKFGLKLGEEGAKLYRRVSQCHPYVKENITPRVEGFLTMFPLNFFCWCCPCAVPLDLICWVIPCLNCCV